MRLRSPSQLRVSRDDVARADLTTPELLAPLARAIHHSHCPACGADVIGFKDTDPDGAGHVQLTCFGDPAHVFFFETGSGHVSGQPDIMGSLVEAGA